MINLRTYKSYTNHFGNVFFGKNTPTNKNNIYVCINNKDFENCLQFYTNDNYPGEDFRNYATQKLDADLKWESPVCLLEYIHVIKFFINYTDPRMKVHEDFKKVLEHWRRYPELNQFIDLIIDSKELGLL